MMNSLYEITAVPMQWNNYTHSQFFMPQGWACPKCGCVWSPSTVGCLHCNSLSSVDTQSTTDQTPDTNDPKRTGMSFKEMLRKYFPNMADEEWEKIEKGQIRETETITSIEWDDRT